MTDDLHPAVGDAVTGSGDGVSVVRVTLPAHLRTLAMVAGEVHVAVDTPVTIARVLDALEAAHPVLRGTIRDRGTHERRAFVRFYACGGDLSHDPPDTVLPDVVIDGTERFAVVGAMAGG
jgi:sulfur-carrier protein